MGTDILFWRERALRHPKYCMVAVNKNISFLRSGLEHRDHHTQDAASVKWQVFVWLPISWASASELQNTRSTAAFGLKLQQVLEMEVLVDLDYVSIQPSSVTSSAGSRGVLPRGMSMGQLGNHSVKTEHKFKRTIIWILGGQSASMSDSKKLCSGHITMKRERCKCIQKTSPTLFPINSPLFPPTLHRTLGKTWQNPPHAHILHLCYGQAGITRSRSERDQTLERRGQRVRLLSSWGNCRIEKSFLNGRAAFLMAWWVQENKNGES